MDTSPEYVKMCEKAEEIQVTEFGETGDVVVTRRELNGYNGWQVYEKGQVCIVGNDGEYDVTQPDSKDFIWLPRQDQLQGMLNQRNITRLVNDFDGFVCSYHEAWFEDTELSMEQLWLAFVMKEKYGKVWDGENWKEVKHEI